MNALRFFISAISLTSLFLTGCHNTIKDEKPANTMTPSSEPSKAEVPNSGLLDIVNTYLEVKNAFTVDNEIDAAAAGKKLEAAFTSFDTSQLPKAEVGMYLDLQSDAKEHAHFIASNGGDIQQLRNHFDMLSSDVYQMMKTFGTPMTLYYDNCPMYNNGQGANWLSETKEISNPYMGKAMPKCGKVKEELQLVTGNR